MDIALKLEGFQLETERLTLKVLDEGAAGAVAAYWLRNREFHRQWNPLRPEEFFTPQHQAELLRNEWELIRADRLFKLWFFEKAEPDRVIGAIALNNIVRGAFQSCHVGYHLDRALVNRGYMTEALRAVIGLAFGELGLHRLEANIMPRNGASLRVAEKTGFQPEGLARQYLRINGVWEDHLHMVLLNEGMA